MSEGKSEGTISNFPSGAPMDHPGHLRVPLAMILLVRDVMACMIYLLFTAYEHSDLIHHEIGIGNDRTKV